MLLEVRAQQQECMLAIDSKAQSLLRALELANNCSQPVQRSEQHSLRANTQPVQQCMQQARSWQGQCVQAREGLQIDPVWQREPRRRHLLPRSGLAVPQMSASQGDQLPLCNEVGCIMPLLNMHDQRSCCSALMQEQAAACWQGPPADDL